MADGKYDSVKVEIGGDSQKKTWKPMSELPKPLTLEEKKYLLAVERGDLANVRRMLQKAHRYKALDINCVDSLGRGSLTLAIDGENFEMVELLVVMGVQTKDALLQAINQEFVEAVELLLEHEELIHKENEPYSWQTVELNTATFTPDITPLILAAHRNNYEILTILLARGATLPMPHDIKCGCNDCIRESKEDSLRQALSRLNEYKALASPSLIALSSGDPILTSFQLSWELRNLAFAEPECKTEYLELRKQCQQFAVDLLHQSRSSQELAIILNHDPSSPHAYEEGEHMKLARLELAIQYKQKKFVAHPNIQQLLAAIWYEGVPGFRRKTSLEKVFIIIRVAVLFPLYCCFYLVFPETKTGKLMRKPFMKFLIHASSYLFFLGILILVSQRAEDALIELLGTASMRQRVLEKSEKQRGNAPALLEYLVVVYVLGFIVEETHEMITEGINSYLRNMWNFIDFSRNFLYSLVFLLRVAAYIQQTQEIAKDPSTAYIPRENWQAFDPQLIAEGLFAGANIFSALKLVHLFSINPHLGPLQISLGRMVIDIVKFFFIYSLVLFAFACGLNQLLWYFSNLERDKCYHLANGEADWATHGDSCMKWRRFANVFESSQSLFWASFGMVDLTSFELTGIKTYTRFWGLLMFGSYSVINVIVLLNLLIAMMSNSYAMIDEHSDTEWKFARTKLWMSYFEESATLPPPFNILPTPKMLLKLFGLRNKDKMRRMSTKRWNKAEKERDHRYTSVMRALVWRYVSAKHRQLEESEVTEDDINEVKGEISSFRYEMLEILGKNGMDVSCADKKEKTFLGKKMKIWERRLMKDFKVAPVATEDEMDELIYQPPPENEDSLARFRRIAKLAVLNSSIHKWRQVVTGACLASQIGHCNSRESFKKQQNLQKAMVEAQRMVNKSPAPGPSTFMPVDLPDITGSSILEVLRDEDDPSSNGPVNSMGTPDVFKQFQRKNPLSPNVLITNTTGDMSIIQEEASAEQASSVGKSSPIKDEVESNEECRRSMEASRGGTPGLDETDNLAGPSSEVLVPHETQSNQDLEEKEKIPEPTDLCKSPKNIIELEKHLDELKTTTLLSQAFVDPKKSKTPSPEPQEPLEASAVQQKTSREPTPIPAIYPNLEDLVKSASPIPPASGKVSPAPPRSGKSSPLAGTSRTPAQDVPTTSQTSTPGPDESLKYSSEEKSEDIGSTICSEARVTSPVPSTSSDGDKKPKKYLAPRPPIQETDDETPIDQSKAGTTDKTSEKGKFPEKSPLPVRNIRKVEDKPKKIQPKYGWL